MARDDNTLHRALLLDHLLTLVGHETCLARGQLESDQALELVNDPRAPSSIFEFDDQGFSDPEVAQICETAIDRIESQSIDLLERVATYPTLEALGGKRADVSRTHRADSLPADLAHRVTIRLVLETWQGSQTRESMLLEHEARAAEIAGETLHVGHVPLVLSESRPRRMRNHRRSRREGRKPSAASPEAWTTH